MSYLIEIPMDSGESLLVSTAGPAPEGLGMAAYSEQGVVKAGESLEGALKKLHPALTKITDQLKSYKPQELSVEFDLTVDAKGGFVVASGGV